MNHRRCLSFLQNSYIKKQIQGRVVIVDLTDLLKDGPGLVHYL